MPYNGSGVYSLPSLPGSFNPAVTGQQATPVDWTTLTADFVAAWNLCLLRNGTSTVSADIPFNSKKITGLADGAAITDAATVGQVNAVSDAVNGLLYQVPVTKTANFTLDPATDLWVINNKTTAGNLVVTLPDATTNPGLVLHFQNYQTKAVESSLSNVRSAEGNPLGLTIVSALAGAWATIVSDGTNWRVTQRGT